MIIRRSRRKTISFEITPRGELLVRAPLRTPDSAIRDLIAEKKEWIDTHIARVRQANAATPEHRYLPGEKFMLLGKTYPLESVSTARTALELRGDRLVLREKDRGNAPRLFEAWYRNKAKEIFTERTQVWSRITGLLPVSIRISSARTRWGSCSSRGTLSLTWRLVMAPLEVVDYVILHELVHLKIKNHSSVFWNAVTEHCPNWRIHRAWLKEHGASLDL